MNPSDKRITAGEIADRLHARRVSGGWRARCPAHNGQNPSSLSISEGDGGRVLLRCHSNGCTYREIMDALGIATATRPVRPPVRRSRPAEGYDPPECNAALLWQMARRFCKTDVWEWWADQLGLPVDALEAVGMAVNGDQLYFPMYDGYGEICGIRTRDKAGNKRAVKGSKAGVFLTTQFYQEHDVVVCEGPTDSAAAVALGFEIIGRPSCTGCERHVLDTCRRLGIEQLTICADADGPGEVGARKLSQVLRAGRIKHRIVTAGGHKDLRAAYKAGVSRKQIEMAWSQYRWD